MMLRFLPNCFVLLMLFCPIVSKGQDKCDFELGADLVSSYVWRGSFVSGTNVQPAMTLKIGGFSVGAWGSVDIAGFGFKEIDLMVSYTLGDFTIGLSDYWATEEESFDYFNLKKDESLHGLELNLAYTLPKIPLTFSWNTMFTGVDNKYLTDEWELKNAYSTYIEAAYAFTFKAVDMEVAVGASPWKSSTMYTGGYRYATDGFAVVNTSLKAAKDIKITDDYSLSVFGQFIVNPAKEDAFFVFGISF